MSFYSPIRATRKTQRLNFMLRAELQTAAGGRLSCRICDLSAEGAKVQLDGKGSVALRLDELVRTEIRGIGPVEGLIVWLRAGFAGISFTAKVDPRLAIKPIGRGGSLIGYGRVPPALRPPIRR